jgi:hypothetical protein
VIFIFPFQKQSRTNAHRFIVPFYSDDSKG